MTTEYLVYQCVPNTSILGQSESIRPTILPRISILLKTRSGYFVQLLSCFVRHFTRAFHTLFGMTFHVLGPRGNLLCFHAWQSFRCFCGKLWIQSWFCNCQQYLCSCRIVFECSQVYVIKERCRFSKINFFIEYFHIGPRFCLFSNQFDVIRIYS